jgi:hypothetical protein
MAPKGNKNAVGHGRPPNEGYSDEELVKLGEELLQWMADCDANKHCDVVHLSEWYSEIKGIVPSYWEKCLTRRLCFSGYYDKAMKWMGKRLLKNKKLAPSYGNRFLGIYFKEIPAHEWEQKQKEIDYEYEKKRETVNVVDEKINTQFDSLSNQISLLQQEARNIRDSKDKQE